LNLLDPAACALAAGGLACDAPAAHEVCRRALPELAAKPVKVAKNPRAGKKAGICGEKCGTGVFEAALCGWQP